MQVNDIVIAGRESYRISGVYLGACGEQSLVGLVPISKLTGAAHGKLVQEMLVPESLVLLANVYRLVVE